MQYQASNFQRHNLWPFKIAVADKKSRRVSEVLRWGAGITRHETSFLPKIVMIDIFRRACIVDKDEVELVERLTWYRISDLRRKMQLDVWLFCISAFLLKLWLFCILCTITSGIIHCMLLLYFRWCRLSACLITLKFVQENTRFW